MKRNRHLTHLQPRLIIVSVLEHLELEAVGQEQALVDEGAEDRWIKGVNVAQVLCGTTLLFWGVIFMLFWV